MRHFAQARLSLYAGGDLGAFARWRTARHLAVCPDCRQEVAAYVRLRDALAPLRETPELHWGHLAAEMKANIRLGLEAGACVSGPAPVPVASPWGARWAMAACSLLVLLGAGFVLQRPWPGGTAEDGVVVQATGAGIVVRGGGSSLGLLHASGASGVTYMVGAQGSLRARYVDPETGYVTVNNVYADQ